MFQRKHPRAEEGDGEIPHRESKRRSALRTVVEDLTRVPALNEAILEPFLRRVVREELEKKFSDFFGESSTSSHSAHPRLGQSEGQTPLQLCFVGQIPSTIFTGSKIESDDPNTDLQILLIDTASNAVVSTGPHSSIKVEIVALNDEFDKDEWTQTEFNDSVQRQRAGRRPLVTGDLTVTLTGGVGSVGSVSFTDNSSWTRSRRFRLGARQILGGVRIREARSGAFVVKDHRGELYKKHHPPLPNDEVWRLERIGKEGAFHKRLADRGINSVKDFVRLCVRDPAGLRAILGGVSKKIWKAIAEHAMNCIVDDNEFFAYQKPELDVVVVFNSVYKVVRASFNGHFLSPEEFSTSQKVLVESLKQQAYRHESELVPIDGLPFAHPALLPAESLHHPTLHHEPHFQALHLDQSMAQRGLNQAPPSNPPTHFAGEEASHQLVPIHPHFVLPQTPRIEDFFPANYSAEPIWLPWGAGAAQAPTVPAVHNHPENLFNFQPSNMASPWVDQQTGFFFTSSGNDEPPAARIIRVSRGRWCKLRAAFKLLAIGQNAARRISNGPMYLGY